MTQDYPCNSISYFNVLYIVLLQGLLNCGEMFVATLCWTQIVLPLDL